MIMNKRTVLVFLCYSINPFVRKIAITHLNDYTGYAVIQFTTMLGNTIYLIRNKHVLSLKDVRIENIQYSLGSSALTILSSYHMTKLLKENPASIVTTQIQVFTIITSYIVDYLLNEQKMTAKQIFGVFLMISGVMISNK